MEKGKENKKELQINVAFDEKKLEAMIYFMEEKKVTLESAMQDHLNELYEKYVPTAMRRYLNRNDTPEQQQGSKLGTRQAEATGQGTTPVKKREDRRQSREQSQSNDAVLAEAQAGEPAEENNQGMSMSM
jgi:hypothetical protein